MVTKVASYELQIIHIAAGGYTKGSNLITGYKWLRAVSTGYRLQEVTKWLHDGRK